MNATTCGICGRPLTDPVSIERGMGPECAAKHSARMARMHDLPGINRSQYDVAKITDKAIWIVDTGEECMSVTNDAERVVAEIDRRYANRRIYYRDSMGNWDELKHDGSIFLGFAPARDKALA